MKNWIYPLMVVIAASSYGVLSTIIKVAMKNGFTAAEAVTAQYFIGFALAALLFFVTQRKMPRIKGWKILVLSGTSTAVTGMVYAHSLNYLPASLAVVLLFQFTWIGMFLDCIVNRRWLKRTEVFSLILLFAGTLFAAGIIGTDLSGIPWQGWAWGIGAAFCFSAFMFVNGKQIEGMDTSARLFYVSLFAAIVVGLFQTPEIVWNGQLFNEGLWIFGVMLGVFGIIMPIYFFSVAVPHVGSGLASILSAMELPVAVLASVIILNEALTFLQICGIFIILIGMVLPSAFNRTPKRVERI
ncbi:drug/metabolite transporter (DMT)-like permease [Planomicrobium stackebrandtii]|uniref:Drug/metabolite transporter (DMT)-like permease n=1 Tax=Planomicrobium stackebrandtii TaxID=253160 RepID=A0ABU0GS39_9BACL|nr:DMT family transporter [Planomicrobium stackebrandtii]MDQ0428176.1 drug/metabolite transporter (DMT)-like permease [Planomicrobium stackebrandtii]